MKTKVRTERACLHCGRIHYSIPCPEIILRKPLAERILRLDDNDRVSLCGKGSETICYAKELKELVR